jgi:putative secretion ATPase (PEP-CTERM system associated)
MYETFYKLRAKPFQLNPDPRFFYGSKGHKRAMAYLEYGLTLAEGFIVITGDVGAGKTTLVRHLLKKLEGQNVIAAQLVSTQLDAEDTLRMVASAYGLEQEGATKATLLKKLEEFFTACLRQDKRVLLIVDEAQNLTPRAVEELRMLSNFQSADRPLLQSFLLGQPEFRRTLQSEGMLQLRQRVIASYHLGPIDAQETRAYILHRLELVGWKSDPAITEEAFQLIYEHSGGIPRKINSLCDRLLLLGFLGEKHTLDKETVQEVIKDLNQEVAYTELPGDNEPTDLELALDPGALQAQPEVLARLEYKLDNMEKSLNRLLPLVRKLLFHAMENNQEKVD